MTSEDHHGEIAPPERLWRSPTWLVGHLAGDAHRLIVEAITAAARTDYAVLAGLDEFGPVSQAALGRRLGIDRSDISVVLDRLQADRHITRSTDPAHHSRKLVQITPTGRQTLHRLDTHVQEAQRALLAPLDPDEAADLTALLQRLVEHHRGYQHSPSSVTEEGVRGAAGLDAGGTGGY